QQERHRRVAGSPDGEPPVGRPRRRRPELLEERAPRRAVVGAGVDQHPVHIEDHAAGGHRTAGSGLASAGGAPTPRRPAARTSISKITPRTLTARQAPRWWSPEPVQGDEGAEGLEGGGAVLRLGPARGLRGGDSPPA